MPKRVDHEGRRAELAAALVRRARTDGLHTIGFREVAAEAGVSANLVQYYFPSKPELLRGGLIYLRERISLRLRERLGALPASVDPIRRARVLLRELLPTDELSDDLYRVHAAYAALALTDTALAGQPNTAGPDELRPELAGLLTGRTDDPDGAAVALLATATGLSAYVASGFLPADRACALLDDQLDRTLSGA